MIDPDVALNFSLIRLLGPRCAPNIRREFTMYVWELYLENVDCDGEILQKRACEMLSSMLPNGGFRQFFVLSI